MMSTADVKRLKRTRSLHCTSLSFDALEQRAMLAADLNFTPLPDSAIVGPKNISLAAQLTPFELGSPYTQTPIARHSATTPLPANGLGQNTLNETGAQVGRYLFATSSPTVDLDADPAPNGVVTRIDLITGERVDLLSIATADGQQDDQTLDDVLWIQNLNAIRWTPWGTLLVAEAIDGADETFMPDPAFPTSENGLVYEIIDPLGDNPVIFARPALGSGLFNGIAIDGDLNLYYDDTPSGTIYRFTPEDPNDPLSFGAIDVLFVLEPDESLGNATWVPIDSTEAEISLFGAASAGDFTDYLTPQDLEFANSVFGPTVYVALQGENSVIAIALDGDPVVSTFVDGNAIDAATLDTEPEIVGLAFELPSDLSIDRLGRLYIGEQQPGLSQGDPGNDVWVTGDLDDDGIVDVLGRMASLTINEAVVNGLYVDPFNNSNVYVSVSDSASQRDGIFLLNSGPQAPGVFEVEIGGQTTLVVIGSNNSDNISITGGNILQVQIGTKRTGGWAPSNNVIVYGQGGNDRIFVATSVIFDFNIYGGAGNDYINAGKGNDLLMGDGGNDNIFTGSGENFAAGGDGNDTISGGADNDDLQGNAGKDRLQGNGGDDSIDGGADNDYLHGGFGNDFLQGGDGNDSVNGYFGDDLLLGNAGNDIMTGGMGVDILLGGLGADNLYATNGDDLLFGERLTFENDTLRLFELFETWLFNATADDRADIMTPLMDPIVSDGAKDILTGGTGVDLFYIFTGKDVAQGVRPGDIVVRL